MSDTGARATHPKLHRMSTAHAGRTRRTGHATRPLLVLLSLGLLHCSSSKPSGDDNDGCFADIDGVTDRPATINLTVDDDAFSKRVLNTQNSSTITFTLTNAGTVPHGFEVACASVTSVYPDVPAGCPDTSCFPDASSVDPIMPGESKTVTFTTPVPDNLIYPFESSSPDDIGVPGLNDGQWSLM